MSKIFQSMAMLVLALIGLAGCDYEARAFKGANPVRVAEMRQTFRDLWLGHIYWVEHAVLYNVTTNPVEHDDAERQVMANAKQIASTVTSFYGEAISEKFYALLTGHYAAVKEYSEATVADSKSRQDAALARLASNTTDCAEFLSGVNPYLPKDHVRGLIATHGAHHVRQINHYGKKEFAHLEETWTMMRQHVYVMADTLMAALAKQFPDKFL